MKRGILFNSLILIKNSFTHCKLKCESNEENENFTHTIVSVIAENDTELLRSLTFGRFSHPDKDVKNNQSLISAHTS